MKNVRHFWVRLLACLMIAGVCTAVSAGGKSCSRCGSHKNLKSVYQLVKICQTIDMPEYSETKQEAFFQDKGKVCYSGYRCDTIHTLWRNCDCTVSCQSHTICGCKTLYGAKATGHHSGCAVRQPYAVSQLKVPLIKWEVVQRCQECCKTHARRAKK